MRAYLAKRLLLALPVMFGVTVLVFAAARVLPGDTAYALAGVGATTEEIEAIRSEHGLDRPVVEQFTRYFVGLLTLNLGQSTYSRLPVVEELWVRLPITVILAISGTLLAGVIGISLGILAARFARTPVDYFVMVISLSWLSVPNYVIGLGFILLFAVTLGVLPAVGGSTPAHFILPVMTIGLGAAGILARQTRSAVLEVLREDYVRTARSKGLPEGQILTRHALANALIPIVTMTGLLFGGLLGGTVIVESIFTMPGVGQYMVDRIANRDYPAVQGGVLLIAFMYSAVNIAVDVLYVLIDKRVRLR